MSRSKGKDNSRIYYVFCLFFFNTKYICVRMCVWMMRLPNINEYIQFEFQLLLPTFYCRKQAPCCGIRWLSLWRLCLVAYFIDGGSKWRSLRFSYDYFVAGPNGLFCVMAKHPERLLQRDICWLGHFRSTHFRRKERSQWKAEEMFIYTANVSDKINIILFSYSVKVEIQWFAYLLKCRWFDVLQKEISSA